MFEILLEVLKIIEHNNYEAYIIGGYSRDKYLNIASDDVDMCTNARPEVLKKIFKDYFVKSNEFGVTTIEYNDITIEITTYRQESNYYLNRYPKNIEFVDDVLIDLQRRDFVINTLMIDVNGQYYDPLSATNDLDNRIIKTVKKANESFKDDALRILRAIRFATILDFDLSDEISNAIYSNKELLLNIPFYFIEREIIKILNSKNSKAGLMLIEKYQLKPYLNDII